MSTNIEETQFLDTPSDETADEFLERTLTFVEEEFSEEKLTGLSWEGIERQRQACNEFFRMIHGKFVYEGFIFADDPEAYEFFFGDSLDMYEPLTAEQKKRIYISKNRVQRSFDKAYTEARERGEDRSTKLNINFAFPISLPPWW